MYFSDVRADLRVRSIHRWKGVAIRLSLVKATWRTAIDSHNRYVLDLCSRVFKASQKESLRIF